MPDQSFTGLHQDVAVISQLHLIWHRRKETDFLLGSTRMLHCYLTVASDLAQMEKADFLLGSTRVSEATAGDRRRHLSEQRTRCVRQPHTPAHS
jgi:hypothetical protein